MKLVEIKINRYPTIVKGIFVLESNDWYYIQDNVGDYVLDGYKILNKKFIRDVKEVREDCFDWKVLNLKYKFSDNHVPIDNYSMLYSFLQKENTLIAIGLKSEKFFYVGRIKKINDKSFNFERIGTKALYIDTIIIKYNSVRFISLHTDYLDSLELYISSVKSEL